MKQEERNYGYYQYVDNIVLLAIGKEITKQMIKKVGKYLEQKLTLNFNITRIVEIGKISGKIEKQFK